MRCNPCASMDSGFRNISAVAPKTLIPSLRGDAVVTDTVRRSSDQTTSRDRRETIPQVFSGRFLGLAPAQRFPFIS